MTDSDANVYVVDTRNIRVQKFDSNDNFITMWDHLDIQMINCKDDKFLIPHDIAIDSEGKIYVTDSGKSHLRAIMIAIKELIIKYNNNIEQIRLIFLTLFLVFHN